MKETIMLLLIALSVTASAVPLKDFRYSSDPVSPNKKFSFTGGELENIQVRFKNTADRKLPIKLKFKSSNSKLGVIGEEFDLNISIRSSNNHKSIKSQFYCRSSNSSFSSAIWRCDSPNRYEVLPDSTNVMEANITAARNIVPGKYSFDFSFLSKIGSGAEVVENKSLNSGEAERFPIKEDNVHLTVKALSKTNLTVRTLQNLSFAPNNKDFIGGISVDAHGEDPRISGRISVRYQDDSLDDGTLDFYYYNSSRNKKRWQLVGGKKYESNNTLVKEVDHFSTYAAFSSQKNQSNGISDFERPNISILNSSDKKENSVGENVQNNNSTDRTQQSPAQSEDKNKTGLDDGLADQGATGSFIGSPTSITGLAIATVISILWVSKYRS